MPADPKAPTPDRSVEVPIVDLVATSSLDAEGASGRWQVPVFLLGFVTLGLTLSVIVSFPPKGTVPVEVWMGEIRSRLLADDPFGARERLRWADRAGWASTEPSSARDVALLAADVYERIGESAPMHRAELAAAVASLREASRGMTPTPRSRLERRMLRLRLESGEIGGVLRKEIETFGDPLLETSLA
ncbi:MAG: hypothetical protein HY608_03045, partial [Planctomycetes bacterium]|nr:hypothetical protein [Planctomycetota bacterium]